MNALERAKAFVNSRAAKTALKIMPLAVAAVVTVGVAPKAQASVALNPTAVYFNGCTPDPMNPSKCCGGFVLDPPTSTNNPGASLAADGGVNGALATGKTNGHFSTGATLLHVGFVMEGDSTDPLPSTVSALTASWNFDITSTDTTFKVDNTRFVFTSDSPATAECNTPGPPADFTDTCSITPTANQILGNWKATLDLTISSGGGGGEETWDISGPNNYLVIQPDAYTPPSGSTVPEPASMLLALSGLPLIGRFIRRKK